MQKGFICPKAHGAHVTIEGCIACNDRCNPLPLQFALLSDRISDLNVYHVTEMTAPLQILYLNRTMDYYNDPLSSVNMIFGTACHKILEDGLRKMMHNPAEYTPHVAESHFEHKIKIHDEDCTLSGTMDLIVPNEGLLADWKTAGGYKVKLLKAGVPDPWKEAYFLQLNIYRVFGFPQAKKMTLVFFIKDWNARMLAKDRLQQVEQVDVPFLDDQSVRLFVYGKMAAAYECLHGGPAPTCSADDKGENSWRCPAYCSVANVCPQLAREEKERGHARA